MIQDPSITSSSELSDELISELMNLANQDQKQFNLKIKELGRRILANSFDAYDNEQKVSLSSSMSDENLAEILLYLDTSNIELILKGVSAKKIKKVFDVMENDDIIDVLDEFEESNAERILKQVSISTRRKVEQLMDYGDGTAGYLMNPNILLLEPTDTVARAIVKIRKNKNLLREYPVLFVQDINGLYGYVSIKRLLITDSKVLISKIAHRQVIGVKTTDDVEEISVIMEKYNLNALSVIDKKNRIRGIITNEDIIDIIVDEATEDIHKLGAVTELHRPYLKSRTYRIVKTRIFWLVFLLFAAMISETIIHAFDTRIAILIPLLPLVIGTAGNSAGQVSATMVRGLATSEIEPSNYKKVFAKELMISIMTGSIIGSINFLRMKYMTADSGTNEDFVISMSIAIIIVMSCLLGGMLPLLAHKIKIDPATMAGPLVTTIVDILGILVVIAIYVGWHNMENKLNPLVSTLSYDDLSLLKDFIKEKDHRNINNLFQRVGPEIIANNANELDDREIVQLSQILYNESFPKFFSFLETRHMELIIKTLPKQSIKRLFDDLYKDDIVDILGDIDEMLMTKVLKSTSKKTKEAVDKLIGYGEGTVGYEMNPEFIEFKKNYTVAKAIKMIKKDQDIVEENSILFVVDSKSVLVGYLHIKDLLLVKPTTKISTITNKSIIYSRVDETIEKAANLIRKFDISRLPVIDEKGILKGTITSDDVVSILVDEATEDINKLNAVSEIDEPYLETSIFIIMKSRIFWLVFLLFMASITEVIIASQNDSATMVLASIIPLVMATAGNGGGQASATVIRALSTGEVEEKDYFKVFWKELKVSMFIAIILFTINFARMYFLVGTLEIKEIIIISSALAMVVIISKLLGGILPLLARKIKLDPATMAGPIVTSIVDIISITVLFTLYTIVILG